MASKGSFLTNDQFLSINDDLVSADGRFRLVMQGLLWGSQVATDMATIRKFAPKVYLHPADKSHPDSVDNYLTTVGLKSGNTVRLDPSGQRMLGAFYSQHKHCVWVGQPPLIDGTHPVVRVTLNSHTCYPTEDVLPGPIFPPIGWLKTVDTTIVAADLVTYDSSPRRFTSVEWTPYASPDQLVVLDGNSQADKWLDFKGFWGPAPLSNRHIDRPPALPSDAQNACFDVATVLKPGIAAFTDLLIGDGPRSPKQQGWWLSKEP